MPDAALDATVRVKECNLLQAIGRSRSDSKAAMATASNAKYVPPHLRASRDSAQNEAGGSVSTAEAVRRALKAQLFEEAARAGRPIFDDEELNEK